MIENQHNRIRLFLLLSVSSTLMGIFSTILDSISMYLVPFVYYSEFNDKNDYVQLLMQPISCLFIFSLIVSLFSRLSIATIHIFRICSILASATLILYIVSFYFNGIHFGNTISHLEDNYAKKLYYIDAISEILLFVSIMLLALAIIPAWRMRCPLILRLEN